MKTKVDQDEWWPVYVIDDDYGLDADIPDELVDQYDSWRVEGKRIQELLREYWDNANG